jgi:hypothetical protein
MDNSTSKSLSALEIAHNLFRGNILRENALDLMQNGQWLYLTPLWRIFCRQLICYEYFAAVQALQASENKQFTPKR